MTGARHVVLPRDLGLEPVAEALIGPQDWQPQVLPDLQLAGGGAQGGPVLAEGGALPVMVAQTSAEACARLARMAQITGHGPSTLTVGGFEAICPLARGPQAPWDRARWDRLAPSRLTALAELTARWDEPTDRLTRHCGAMLSRGWGRHLAKGSVPPTRADLPDLARLRVAQQVPQYQGYFRMDQIQLQVPQYDGTLSPQIERELYIAHDAALLLPYDPRRDVVALVEQFRLGVWGRGDPHPWMLEPTAGHVDAGEDPADAARREAREEAGLDLHHIEPIARIYASPGYATDYFHLFLGLCDLPERGPWMGGAEAEHENIRTHLFSYESAMAMVDSGEISVGPLVLMLHWLARHRDRLRGAA